LRGRRLRVDLSPSDTVALAAVLEGIPSETAIAVRTDGQVFLLVAGLRLRVRGPDLTRDFRQALKRRVSQPAVTGGC
jgi:hypothetical protein